MKDSQFSKFIRGEGEYTPEKKREIMLDVIDKAIEDQRRFMSHTKEPWSYDDMRFIMGDDSSDAIAQADKAIDAQRIVACVNACAGLDTEALEIYALNGAELPDVIKLSQRNAELEAQNAALTEQLNSAIAQEIESE